WAEGYLNDKKPFFCPGFRNEIDEIAKKSVGWQWIYIVQPGDRKMPDLLEPIGKVVCGEPTFISTYPSGIAKEMSYLMGTYSFCFRDPSGKVIKQWHRRPVIDYPLILCAQSIHHPNQATAPLYQQALYSSHGREAMNCTYGDGSSVSLKDVGEYSQSLTWVSDWTWQCTATAHSFMIYWWPWAMNQRRQ
ncbi:MAG: hypothetical protein HQL31_06650, partial [Planctomycetes bacterium]|nr:hypothetical protein [Planctomycetota bacterium]